MGAGFMRYKPAQWIASLDELFGIDLRALAAVRIGFAVLILSDLFVRATALSEHYGGGVLPAEAALSFWNHNWSIHLIGGGETWWVAMVFAVHAIAAGALLVGYRSKTAAFVSWLLLVSLHNANPLIIQGGDTLLRVSLFVMLFLPIGRAYALDVHESDERSDGRTLSAWSAAYLIQVAFLYFFAVRMKIEPEWLVDGTAVYYALSIDRYATPLAQLLLQFPPLLSAFTAMILFLQHVALPLLFSPVWNRYVRTVTVVALMAMHVGFMLCLYIGHFAWVSLVALMPFLPVKVWDMVDACLKIPPPTHRTPPRTGDMSPPLLRWGTNLLGCMYIAFIALWQASLSPAFSSSVRFPDALVPIATLTRIDQQWDIFSQPLAHDGWHVVLGVQEDGDVVNLWDPGHSIEEKSDVAGLYPNERWRKFMTNYTIDDYAVHRVHLARMLCDEWSADFDARLQRIEIRYVSEDTPPPRSVASPRESHVLISHPCEK